VGTLVALTNDGKRNGNSSSPSIWRGRHHPFIALNKERQPKQTAAFPVATLIHDK
jgi:hypothetical protein